MAESKRFLLRLDPALFDALRRWSDDELRSINGQIEYLLTDQARRAGRLPKPATRRPPRPASAEPEADEDADAEGEGEDDIDALGGHEATVNA
jgi:hypothetical protein